MAKTRMHDERLPDETRARLAAAEKEAADAKADRAALEKRVEQLDLELASSQRAHDDTAKGLARATAERDELRELFGRLMTAALRALTTPASPWAAKLVPFVLGGLVGAAALYLRPQAPSRVASASFEPVAIWRVPT